MTFELDLTAALAILVALALGGVLKGATGAGAPVIAVPVMAAFVDVRLAVIVMVLPNVVTNLWQSWRYRAHHLKRGFAAKFAVGGGVGAFAGTVLLATLPAELLSLIMALAVFGYIGLRLAQPEFRLGLAPAERLLLPVGFAGGMLQGAAGISAPVTISFLNAMRLERQAFIVTISVFFAAMSLFQIATLAAFGLLTPRLLGLGGIALAPLLAGMPVGNWAARHMSVAAFDRTMLVVLALLALRLIWSALA